MCLSFLPLPSPYSPDCFFNYPEPLAPSLLPFPQRCSYFSSFLLLFLLILNLRSHPLFSFFFLSGFASLFFSPLWSYVILVRVIQEYCLPWLIPFSPTPLLDSSVSSLHAFFLFFLSFCLSPPPPVSLLFGICILSSTRLPFPDAVL